MGAAQKISTDILTTSIFVLLDLWPILVGLANSIHIADRCANWPL